MRAKTAVLLLLAAAVLLCPPAVASGQSAGANDVERRRGEAVAPELLQKVIEKDVDAFVESVERGDAAAVRLFLSAGLSPEAGRDQTGGEEVLLRAISRGHVEVVEALLDYGADVGVRGDPDLVPALTLAVKSGRVQIVKALLERKADVNAGDDDGHTALMIAAGAAALTDVPPEAQRFISGEEDGPDGDDAWATLKRTPREERFEMLRMLLDAGADPNRTAEDCGLSALMFAAMYGSPDVTRLLLGKGADPNTGKKEWNALRFATMTQEEVLEDLGDESSRSPETGEPEAVVFYRATLKGREEVARLLRQAGAKERWQWPDEPEEEGAEEAGPARH